MISLLPTRVSPVRFIAVYIECVVLIRAVLLASVVLHHHLQSWPPASQTYQEPAGVQVVGGKLIVEGLVVDWVLGVDLHC